VGESGCGKSTLGLAVIGLLPAGITSVSGKVVFKGEDLLAVPVKELATFRGTQVSMIFQEPMSSLNPVFKAGDQIAEAIGVREARRPAKSEYGPFPQQAEGRKGRWPTSKARYKEYGKAEALRYLQQVRIPDPAQVAEKYPHELSGGMRQRVMIAMALAERPSLLIADEPTTALDVTTQAQILLLMDELTKDFGTSLLYITHDLDVAGTVAERIIVMYAGQVVEDCPSAELFHDTLHPYTKGLLASTPTTFKGEARLEPIKGSVPNLSAPPAGCRFHPRCPFVMEKCRSVEPALLNHSASHSVRCHLYG
jgi:oligopeptide/dipeptide ABC transporter ATP-binding protein